MSVERKAKHVLEEAQKLAETASTWADFSNQLFSYPSGLVPQTFPDEMERQAFFDSEYSKEIDKLLLDLMKKSGTVAGAVPKEKSGKFVVRVPKTIHQELENEAKLEGVSLNQLAVSKLSISLGAGFGKTHSIALLIAQAFNNVHEGHSQDWVILEPHHNRLFIERCRELGLHLGEHQLNHLLMNIRKNPKYKGILNPTTVRSGFTEYDDCAFASEIAVRTLQRTRGATLDHILCDPILRQHFDEIAMRLAPGQTEVKLRCAALNLRKTHRLKPTPQGAGDFDLVTAGPLRQLSVSQLAAMPGTYVFYDYTRPIYASETDNLQRRIDMHLRGGLPGWLEASSDEGFILKYQVLPSARRENRLKWVASFINRERPVLNYQLAS
jgi:hypothetical protein